jgi:hypothetical protein
MVIIAAVVMKSSTRSTVRAPRAEPRRDVFVDGASLIDRESAEDPERISYRRAETP